MGIKGNLKLVITAQAIVMLASLVKAFVLPKILTVDYYSFWQVYVLYSGYVGIFSLGYSDGVYLLYGDREYNKLPFKELRATNRLFALILMILTVLLAGLVILAVHEPNKRSALLWTVLDIPPVCLIGLVLYIFQITNRFSQYRLYSVLDKILIIAAIGFLAFFAPPLPGPYEAADCLVKYVICFVVLVKFRELFFGSAVSLKVCAKNYLTTSKVGLSLLFANMIGMLVIGAGRIVVELSGDVASYAYYSFGVSVTNVLLAFVTAASLVVYPHLKRLDSARYSKYFRDIEKIATVGALLCIGSYFILSKFVDSVFPDYKTLVSYLPFLLLSVAGQIKMQVLNNSFYKALRMEKRMLAANVQSIALFVLLGLPGYVLTGNAWFIAFGTGVALIIRSWMSEFEICRVLDSSLSKTTLFEIALSVGFSLSAIISFFQQGYSCWLPLIASACFVSAIYLFVRFRHQSELS
ncbi:hypothetical protein VJ923_11960 [Adlercreutzia sp. R25]|uniref:lipopolysaccharide biosynthesis protein n=1 Tax=Adlercreutzia shanghongiae TaxID=3111773 RepID=UPI002DBA7974|nr:hypothetical protein [Adlercreutzia sp. R25]MEC4273873.1 hypothetical protein [Adlercreutzia sp. R25]